MEIKSHTDLPNKSVSNDPDLINLGGERKNTKYSLCDKPTRNRRYFNTQIMIPADPTMPPSGNTYDINTKVSTHESDSHTIVPKGILKVKTAKKSINQNLEISSFENCSKPAKKALREAFILQKQLKTPTPNQKLADFIIRGQFNSNKKHFIFSTYRRFY